jgi:hypothetical protein
MLTCDIFHEKVFDKPLNPKKSPLSISNIPFATSRSYGVASLSVSSVTSNGDQNFLSKIFLTEMNTFNIVSQRRGKSFYASINHHLLSDLLIPCAVSQVPSKRFKRVLGQRNDHRESTF